MINQKKSQRKKIREIIQKKILRSRRMISRERIKIINLHLPTISRLKEKS